MSRLLVIAPHPDDEVLGAGGTIARFARAGGHVTVATIAAHAPPLYPPEAKELTTAQAREAHEQLGVAESIFLDYAAVFTNQVPVHEINGKVVEILRDAKPDVVLMPYYDRHIDHRCVFDAAMVATRPIGAGKGLKVVAAYETLSETHWNAPQVEPNFTPNWVVNITDTIDAKLEAMSTFAEQVHPFPGPRSIEALRALAIFRGTQAGFGYGEGFHVLRMNAAPEVF